MISFDSQDDNYPADLYLKVAKQVAPGGGTGCVDGITDWNCTTVGGRVGSDDCPTCQLVLNGAVIAFGGVDLGRDLGDSNPTTPAEVFNYDPAYLYLFAQVDATTKETLLGEEKSRFLEIEP